MYLTITFWLMYLTSRLRINKNLTISWCGIYLTYAAKCYCLSVSLSNWILCFYVTGGRDLLTNDLTNIYTFLHMYCKGTSQQSKISSIFTQYHEDDKSEYHLTRKLVLVVLPNILWGKLKCQAHSSWYSNPDRNGPPAPGPRGLQGVYIVTTDPATGSPFEGSFIRSLDVRDTRNRSVLRSNRLM